MCESILEQYKDLEVVFLSIRKSTGEVITPSSSKYISKNITSSMRVIVPNEQELSLMILEKVVQMEAKTSEVSKLNEIIYDTNGRLKAKDETLANIPKWYTVAVVAKLKGLSGDAVRKQLKNGEFEDGVDFKMPDGTILIHQGAVERIHRRRSSNG